MSTQPHISEGQILTGALFNDSKQVVKVHKNEQGIWEFGLVGRRSGKFRSVILTSDEITDHLSIIDPTPSHSGDG